MLVFEDGAQMGHVWSRELGRIEAPFYRYCGSALSRNEELSGNPVDKARDRNPVWSSGSWMKIS